MKKCLFFFLLLVCFRFVSFADEGMWLPQLLEQLNEKRMKSLGMKISAKDIYNVNKGSLKDAIVSFGGFCTGEVISDQGLVLTNHHCGFASIQSHSTIDNNLLRDGFWAKNLGMELPNPDLFVTFIVRIDDVTKAILTNVTDNMSEREKQKTIAKNMDALKKATPVESYQDILIRAFFDGNQYYRFITETYKDVRLVGAPPSSIGNFGKDTDNWTWPRHTGDFSMFRIYADKNNKPAGYSPDNVPYKPKKSLTISLKGTKENDFTMIFGFPGRTQEYLPAIAVEEIVNSSDPIKIDIRTNALGIMDKYMRSDEGIKIQYAKKYASIANAWKKWQGEVLGLTKTDGVGKKKKYEAEFLKLLNTNPTLKSKYQHVLPEITEAYKEIKPYNYAKDVYIETTGKIELYSLINRINALRIERDKKEKGRYSEKLINEINQLPDFFKDYNKQVDKDLFAAMMQMYVEKNDPAFVSPQILERVKTFNYDYKKWAEDVYAKSAFVNREQVMNLLKNNPDELYNLAATDVMGQIVSECGSFYNKNVKVNGDRLQEKINDLQRSYMQAQMAVMKSKTFYPDANSTLRVAYGNVKGFYPADGKYYYPFTYLDGVMEKYVPGDYEFDVPQKLRELYKAKDYGQYSVNGKVPVCFIASNHTTGGNSGSPALDANGNLIGLNFDRAWEGTMSDINYDPSICRNIMVDIRYVLFIVDKFAGAKNLIDEMKMVR
ncbi:MAG TPA: S46 family peptidase [Niabella sp.]|nr:S46 family peptidase [Chitinophagaceae bacterium]HRO84786.1 S46 family peptidase [Niabella sp.]